MASFALARRYNWSIRGTLTIVRVAGVPIRVHWSFSLLLLFVLGSAYQSSGVGRASAIEYAALWLGILFVSVTLHELSHSLVAKRLGLRVRDIVLLPIGGVSEIEGMDATPSIESKVAIAGPLASVVIGGLFLLLSFATGSAIWPPTFSGSSWLVDVGWLNLGLAAFNMLPALPLDGGRVFRSTLARFGNRLLATRVAAGTASLIGIGLVVYGVMHDFWLVIIGAFVLFGASAELRQARVVSAVQALTVRSLMYPDQTTVPVNVAVGEVARWLWNFPSRGLAVVDDTGGYVGIVNLRELNGIEPEVAVGTVCDRRAPLLNAEMPVYPAVVQAFQRSSRHELAVAENGSLVGILYLPALNEAVSRAQTGLEDASVGSRL